MKGTFRRVSPAKFAENIGIPAGWFVISHRWMPEKLHRRKAHGAWFKIKSTETHIFRILRFSPNLEGSLSSDSGEIVLDWVGWIDLFGRVEDVNQGIKLEITKARWRDYPKIAVSHPDPTIRMSGYLGLISVALGLLSLLLTIYLS